MSCTDIANLSGLLGALAFLWLAYKANAVLHSIHRLKALLGKLEQDEPPEGSWISKAVKTEIRELADQPQQWRARESVLLFAALIATAASYGLPLAACA